MEMAILEKEISIIINTRHISHFENLGYIIPRYKYKDGTIHVKRGTQLTVKVEDLPDGSNLELTKICDDCDKPISNQPYYAIIGYRKSGDGKDRCQDCGSIQAGKNRKNNMAYENSLEYFALNNNKEYLLNEFSDKNNKSLKDISYGTGDEYLWNCPKCGNEYPMVVTQRTSRDFSCPYCCVPSKKILIGFNDLWTTHPHIANLLTDNEKGYKLSFGSDRKEKFKCDKCGSINEKSVNYVVNYGFTCTCSDGISYPEKFMMSVLDQINIDYIPQKTFKWSEKKRYDFYIQNLNLIIEIHGQQHYKWTGFNRSLEEEQQNDKYKMNLAISNDINEYIVIDCRMSNLDYIKNSILNSKLNGIFNFEKIDWKNAYEFAMKSLVKTVCDLFNNGITDTKQLGKMVKLNKSTIVKYLKQGNEIGWCNYNTNRIKRSKYKINNQSKVV